MDGHLQRAHVELRIQALGELLTEYLPGEEISDFLPIQKHWAHCGLGDFILYT